MFSVARQPLGRVAVQVRLGQLVHDPLAEPLAEARTVRLRLRRHLPAGELAGRAEADDQRHRQRARTACRARGRRRRSAAPAGRAGPSCGRTGPRCPSARTSCGPSGSAGRCPSSSTSSGTLPTACTASVWNRTPFSLHSLPIAVIGWRVPISLFAAMIDDEDRLVGERLARPARRDTWPYLSTGRYVTWKPSRSSRLQVSSDGLVLGRLGDDVVALLLVHRGDALDGEVVALGRAAGEDDLLAGRADQGGDLVAGLLDGLLGLPAERRGCGWRRCRTSR